MWLLDLTEQPADLDAERVRKPHDRGDASVLVGALDAADVLWRESSANSELLLGEVTSPSFAAQRPSERDQFIAW